MYNRTYYRTVVVNGTKIFYREAGSSNAPTLLLLHGFPSSSHMFLPDGRSLDDFYLASANADEVQLDLFKDYANNVALYPQFQQYFRKYQPPLLAVWGKNDPFFSSSRRRSVQARHPQGSGEVL